jgi:flagellar FliL protein
MFERDKSNNEIKSFDIDLSTENKKAASNSQDQPKSKKPLFIGIALVALLSGAGAMYFKSKITSSDNATSINNTQTMFIPMNGITVSLRQGMENNAALLKVTVTLEVNGKNNYDIVTQMMPKIMDIFQTYLKELRKNDLDGSFGIYKIKDEMMMRINSILYPAKIEAILFQDFMIQVL